MRGSTMVVVRPSTSTTERLGLAMTAEKAADQPNQTRDAIVFGCDDVSVAEGAGMETLSHCDSVNGSEAAFYEAAP